MKLTGYEKKTYVMKDKEDFIILSKIKELEKKNLSKEDKEIINLIRTQLKKNWRLPLINYLNLSLKEYKRPKKSSCQARKSLKNNVKA